MQVIETRPRDTECPGHSHTARTGCSWWSKLQPSCFCFSACCLGHRLPGSGSETQLDSSTHRGRSFIPAWCGGTVWAPQIPNVSLIFSESWKFYGKDTPPGASRHHAGHLVTSPFLFPLLGMIVPAYISKLQLLVLALAPALCISQLLSG